MQIQCESPPKEKPPLASKGLPKFDDAFLHNPALATGQASLRLPQSIMEGEEMVQAALDYMDAHINPDVCEFRERVVVTHALYMLVTSKTAYLRKQAIRLLTLCSVLDETGKQILSRKLGLEEA